MMTREEQIAYSLIRFEYYVAGRHLFFNCHTKAAKIMLGYAVECQIKMALLLKGSKNRKLLHRHDIPALHGEAARIGALTGVAASSDFLRFVNDGLNQRYPSQLAAMLRQATADGLVVGSTAADILPYDDYILQVDDSIRQLSSEPLASVGVRGALSGDCVTGLEFFHCNGAAFKRFPQYVAIVKAFRSESGELIARLDKGPESFWRYPRFPLSLPGDPATLAACTPASDYEYPKQFAVTDENGNTFTGGVIYGGIPYKPKLDQEAQA
jgi:hypothetical protein